MAAVIRTIAPPPAKARAWSWAELVAETAGLGELEGLEVTVQSPEPIPAGWRVVIQERSVEEPQQGPLASAQRSVGGDRSLRGGLQVKLYRATPGVRTEVIAWLEPGTADLEYDGLRAAPGDGAWVAHATLRRGSTGVRLHLAPRHQSAVAAA